MTDRLCDGRRRSGGIVARAMDITVAERSAAGITVVTLHGELGVDSAGLLRKTLAELIDQYRIRIVVDLAPLAFCDSIGLSAFIDGHRRCAEVGGWMRLAGARPFLCRILEVVGLLGIVQLYDSVPAACTGDESRLVKP